MTYIGDVYVDLRGQNTHFTILGGQNPHKTPQNWQ